MLHSLVGELMDWVFDTTDDYGMVMSLSKYLMAQGELTFEDTVSDPSNAPADPYVWTQLVK